MSRSCPSQICDDFRDKLCAVHRYGGPSWKNTKADQWCSSHWQVAKSFMPPDGYQDVSTFDETDFNGIISFMINCTEIQRSVSFNITNQPNVLTTARQIGRSIRHSPYLKVTDNDLADYFATLNTLLTDSKYLASDSNAQQAVIKLKELEKDTLSMSFEDVHELLENAKTTIEVGKHEFVMSLETGKQDIQDVVTGGIRAVETGKREIESTVSDGKCWIDTKKRQLEETVSKRTTMDATRKRELEELLLKGNTALAKGKFEIEEAVSKSNIAIETGIREMKETLMESKTAIATGKLEMEETLMESKTAIATGKLEMEETLMESITAFATGKLKMEETLMESKTAIATGKLEMEETILEGKISIETGKRVIEATASEAVQRLTDVSSLSNVVRTKEVTRKIKISLYGRGKKDKRKTEVEDLRIRLAKYYKKHLNSAPLSPLLSDKDERLDTFYVPPKIFEVDHRKIGAIQTEERTLVFSYRELFCKSDEFMKKVFIVGKAGMGKSSCAAMCAIKWANQFSSTDTRINNDENTSHQKTAQNNSFEDDTFYRKIDFLFHLTLRDSCKLCNLTDMIQDQLINVIYHQDERATAYLTMRTVFSNHRCVIIADGLDEWSHPNETNCGWSQADKIVPHLPPTIDATVVFTSRPCRMSQQRVKDTTIDKYLEIEGTTNIELLIQKTLDSLNKTATEKKCMFEFLGYVNRMKLERLLEVPFISMFLVCLWFEGSLKSFSLCNIYAYIIDMICARKPFPEQIEPQKYISFPQCFQHTEYVQRYYSTVMEMAKLAFTTLFSNDQTSPLLFRKIDGLSHVNLVFLLKSGILNETKTASSIRKSSSYSFIDKTVQEFLAAIYMSHHPKEIDRVVKPFYLKSGDTSAVSQVFIFLCGLNIESANEMSAMISKSIFTYNDGIIVDVDETRTQCTITPSYKSMYNDDLHKAKYRIRTERGREFMRIYGQV
ncbi:uncharacterized protein LOC128222512 [Mya arenaria]|uniref:uncharacterized protein LOC128222512 n=1 Tax=Mya arenaria TaxID=6604 RepID=UPI0022E4D689|nr:uncharacterized protein LOC128222512 [Mya arenaria]